MKVSIKYTEKQINDILKNMVIIVDSREQNNKHIIDYFEKKKVAYKVRKLEFGDYSCMIKANEEMKLQQDVSLENTIVIEKKNSLEELSGNLTDKRTEFENEFMRAKFKKCDVHMIVENGSWGDILNHNYNTKFNEKAYYNSLLSFLNKYDISLTFIEREYTAIHILRIIQTKLKSYIKE